MRNLKPAQAGTLESSDMFILVEPLEEGDGIVIELQSIVLAQYGEQIRKRIEDTVRDQGVTDIFVKAVDRGALDCTIRARTLAVLHRAGITLKEGSSWS